MKGGSNVLKLYWMGESNVLKMYWMGVQVGAFERDPQKIADLLTRWFGQDRAQFTEMARRARLMGLEFKSALFRIVADLADLCNKYSTQPLLSA